MNPIKKLLQLILGIGLFVAVLSYTLSQTLLSQTYLAEKITGALPSGAFFDWIVKYAGDSTMLANRVIAIIPPEVALYNAQAIWIAPIIAIFSSLCLITVSRGKRLSALSGGVFSGGILTLIVAGIIRGGPVALMPLVNTSALASFSSPVRQLLDYVFDDMSRQLFTYAIALMIIAIILFISGTILGLLARPHKARQREDLYDPNEKRRNRNID